MHHFRPELRNTAWHYPKRKDLLAILVLLQCNQYNIECNVKHFQQNFKNWTSGNDDIDKFIQDIQISANSTCGFGKVYRAKWIDGYIISWDDKIKNWKRLGSNMFVTLKSLNNSENVTSEFINEISTHCKIDGGHLNFSVTRVYGITQDPETKSYMMVLQYAENGSLRNYLDGKYYDKSNWRDKLYDLWHIACGLSTIHGEELIHRDLHSGNVLKFPTHSSITDMGLCKPADYNASKNTNNINLYGVLPYIAPEILRGQSYTKAADIYSFGIIMYEVISGSLPYYDVSHDNNLAIKICQGLRPRFSIKVPQLIVHLIKKCLDGNPLNRPEADEICSILYSWWTIFDDQIELQKQIKEAKEINNNLPTGSIPLIGLGLSSETHSEAVYTSRLLNFNNLPKPKNSDDYYDEQNDNIISMKFSESLQIDLSQLKININDQNIEPKGEEEV
ncbi:unnamed protein product [Rhizophagus irregularis]|nr:unnamed protein product [Rhizophagus irregularis]